MESRGTGLRPQRPAGWEQQATINFKSPGGPNSAPQGPAKGPAVTSRSMQAPIPGEIGTQLQQGPGGFLGQILMGRPGMEGERSRPGNDGNTAKGGFGASGGPAITGSPTVGNVMGSTHFGASKGGF